METRMMVMLDAVERNALSEWAQTELRDPRDQIRLFVREALERRGLLEPPIINELSNRENVESQSAL